MASFASAWQVRLTDCHVPAGPAVTAPMVPFCVEIVADRTNGDFTVRSGEEPTLQTFRPTPAACIPDISRVRPADPDRGKVSVWRADVTLPCEGHFGLEVVSPGTSDQSETPVQFNVASSVLLFDNTLDVLLPPTGLPVAPGQHFELSAAVGQSAMAFAVSENGDIFAFETGGDVAAHIANAVPRRLPASVPGQPLSVAHTPGVLIAVTTEAVFECRLPPVLFTNMGTALQWKRMPDLWPMADIPPWKPDGPAVLAAGGDVVSRPFAASLMLPATVPLAPGIGMPVLVALFSAMGTGWGHDSSLSCPSNEGALFFPDGHIRSRENHVTFLQDVCNASTGADCGSIHPVYRSQFEVTGRQSAPAWSPSVSFTFPLFSPIYTYMCTSPEQAVLGPGCLSTSGPATVPGPGFRVTNAMFMPRQRLILMELTGLDGKRVTYVSSLLMGPAAIGLAFVKALCDQPYLDYSSRPVHLFDPGSEEGYNLSVLASSMLSWMPRLQPDNIQAPDVMLGDSAVSVLTNEQGSIAVAVGDTPLVSRNADHMAIAPRAGHAYVYGPEVLAISSTGAEWSVLYAPPPGDTDAAIKTVGAFPVTGTLVVLLGDGSINLASPGGSGGIGPLGVAVSLPADTSAHIYCSTNDCHVVTVGASGLVDVSGGGVLRLAAGRKTSTFVSAEQCPLQRMQTAVHRSVDVEYTTGLTSMALPYAMFLRAGQVLHFDLDAVYNDPAFVDSFVNSFQHSSLDMAFEFTPVALASRMGILDIQSQTKLITEGLPPGITVIGSRTGRIFASSFQQQNLHDAVMSHLGPEYLDHLSELQAVPGMSVPVYVTFDVEEDSPACLPDAAQPGAALGAGTGVLLYAGCTSGMQLSFDFKDTEGVAPPPTPAWVSDTTVAPPSGGWVPLLYQHLGDVGLVADGTVGAAEGLPGYTPRGDETRPWNDYVVVQAMRTFTLDLHVIDKIQPATHYELEEGAHVLVSIVGSGPHPNQMQYFEPDEAGRLSRVGNPYFSVITPSGAVSELGTDEGSVMVHGVDSIRFFCRSGADCGSRSPGGALDPGVNSPVYYFIAELRVIDSSDGCTPMARVTVCVSAIPHNTAYLPIYASAAVVICVAGLAATFAVVRSERQARARRFVPALTRPIAGAVAAEPKFSPILSPAPPSSLAVRFSGALSSTSASARR